MRCYIAISSMEVVLHDYLFMLNCYCIPHCIDGVGGAERLEETQMLVLCQDHCFGLYCSLFIVFIPQRIAESTSHLRELSYGITPIRNHSSMLGYGFNSV